jgi:phenylpropionate dioxygenase-like ring-hydroxylating dioxygenase large terminal subunit
MGLQDPFRLAKVTRVEMEDSSMRRLPEPSTPRGWYRALYSDELEARGVVPLSMLGQELVAFRGTDGVARVVDAYCPHLGAHLGHGGKVEENALVCPFHAWAWDGNTGECQSIPYAKRIPKGARIETWPTRETNGYVTFWYDLARGAPDFEIPDIPETHDPDFELYKRVKWTLETHIQEIYENVVDVQHFISLHQMDVKSVSWEPVGEEDGPIVRLAVHLARESAAQSDERGETEIESFMYGPGLQVTRLHGRMQGVSVNSLTPTNDGRLEVGHAYYVRHSAGAERAEVEAFWDYYMDDHALDFNIWNHKTYLPNPALAAEDGDIAGFRRWFRQFYPAVDPSASLAAGGGHG